MDIADDISLRQLLRSWSNCHGITTRAINDLLKILKRTGIVMIFKLSNAVSNISTIFWKRHTSGIENLPIDYRSLLQTPRHVEITAAAGGRIWYNGIEKNLRQIFSKLDRDVSIALNFNVDGLPIFKSSKQEFWPILANIYGNICDYIFKSSIYKLFKFVYNRYAQYPTNDNWYLVWRKQT